MLCRFPKFLAVLTLGLLVTAPPCARAAEVWFAATEPVWRAVRGWPPNDWMALFQPNAPWQRAAAQVQVFELSKRAVLETNDSDLATVLNSLRQHHIRIAVQATPLLASQICGLGIEGHGPANDMVQVARRLKRFGADLAYLTMDEPLWFGHFYNGTGRQRSCHSSIVSIAQQAASKMKAVRQIYPGVVIGDDEPIGVPDAIASEWPEDIRAWLGAYRDAMGEPMGFLRADVVWQRKTWLDVLRRVIAVVRGGSVTFGIIYNGTPADTSDADWINDAQSHFEMIEGTLHIRPGQVMLQSWMDRPRAMLPETRADTMTNLVLRYGAWLARGQ